jgi:hypothetical protein
MKRDSELLEVIGALRAAGRFAGGLDRGQQECDQDPDDCDHHE